MIRRLLASLLVILTACSGGAPLNESTPASSTTSVDESTTSTVAVDESVAASVVCDPDSTVPEPLVGPEVQARTNDPVEAWALFFPTFRMRPDGEPIEIPAETEIKIVWRVTGEGDFSIEAAGPGGLVIGPDWGPEMHGGSTWDRPGDEWGTGWTFPETGCWTFEINRGEAVAHLSVMIY